MAVANPFSDIRISATAKSKAFRMYKPRHIRDALRRRNGTLYRKGTTNEYHLHTSDERVTDGETWVIAFAVEPDHITVITQMHLHFDYEENPLYTPVPTPFEHVGAVPAATA